MPQRIFHTDRTAASTAKTARSVFVMVLLRNAMAGLTRSMTKKVSIIKDRIREKYPNAYFALPEFSSDNAAGVALLARQAYLADKNKK